MSVGGVAMQMQQAPTLALSSPSPSLPAHMFSTQRSFQTTYAPLLGPRPGTIISAQGHQVTQRSLDRSWASLTSPQRTGGLVPSEYSQRVEQDYRHTNETKRMGELVNGTSTGGGGAALASPSRRHAAAGLQVVQGAHPSSRRAKSVGGGRRRTQSPPGRRSGRKAQQQQLASSVRLVPPVRSVVGGPQRGDYELAGPYNTLPNPAVLPSDADAAAAALRCFPFTSRPQHHTHQLNPQVRGGYYATHHDDRFNEQKYQQYEVEIVNTARPQFDASADGALSPGSSMGSSMGATTGAALAPSMHSDTPPALAATALGFGRRHAEYKRYVHQTPPSSLQLDASGPLLRTAVLQDKVVMEVAPHLLEHLSGAAAAAVAAPVNGEGAAATAAPAPVQSLALAVPYKLARFVPMDDRDGQGKGGHVNASGLGFGKGHRNYHKYLQPNAQGDPQLAYFRSNHRT